MNNETPSVLTAAELRTMHHEPVLVLPGRSIENPAVGMRGTIQVTPDHDVEIVLQFADMFDRPATSQVIRLLADSVRELYASKAKFGDYVITLDDPLHPPPTVGYVVASPRL